MRCAFAIAFSVLVLSAAPATAQTSVGVLTCSSEGKEAARRTLNCTLRATSGSTSRFQGVMKTPIPVRDWDRRVYVWYVSAPRGTRPSHLAGRYVRDREMSRGGRRPILVGGRKDAIVLQPPLNKDQLPGEGLPAVLELDLKALKA